MFFSTSEICPSWWTGDYNDGTILFGELADARVEIFWRDAPRHRQRHPVPGVAEEGYSVEFFDMTGNTVGVAILPATALRMCAGLVARFSDAGKEGRYRWCRDSGRRQSERHEGEASRPTSLRQAF
jgi:hypothetical protein